MLSVFAVISQSLAAIIFISLQIRNCKIMKKFFLVNLIFLLTLNITIKSFWILGIDRSVQNALPSGEYGIYFTLLNFTFLFNIILDCGITNFNNKTIAQNTFLLKKYFARILSLKLVLSVVYMCLVFLVALFSGYDKRLFSLLFWLAILQVLTYLLTYLRSNISALLMFKTDSILSVLDKTLTIIFCSILLWTNFLKTDFKVEYFVYAQVLSMFLSVLVAFIIVLSKTGFIRLVWNRSFNFAILKYGLPFAILSLLMAFYNKIDSVFLERLLDDKGVASGIYAAGFRLVDSANMVSYLFSVILLPLFAKLIKDKVDVKEILKISSHLLLLVSVVFAIVSFLYSEELMSLLYNKNITQSASVYRILCFCFIPISATYIFGTLLTANGSLKYLNIVATFGMLINIGLNLILIPQYREEGAAITSLTAQSITAVLQIVLALKIFHIKFNLRYCIQLLLFVVGLAIACLFIYKLNIDWISRVLISGVVGVVLSFLFGIFNPKELSSFLIQSIKERK